jgi:hypothetical protein
VKVSQKDLEMIKSTSKTVWNDLAGRLYPKALLDEAISAVEKARSSGN